MPNGEGHRILTHAALRALPEWEWQLLIPVRDRLENEYCMYGDDYFKDPVRIGPYIKLPDDRLPMDPWEVRHFRKDGPGKDYYTCGYYDLMRYSFEYFAGRCIESIKSGNVNDFARFAGSLVHVIEDCGAPPHAVGTEMGTDMKFIKMLYPSSDIKQMAGQFHAILENRYEPFIMQYTPELLGCSTAEISFNMLERFTDLIENSVKFIIPLLNAFYKDDEKSQAKILAECGQSSAKMLADFIHSTLAVGTGHLEGEEMERLNIVSLGGLTPLERSAWAPPPYPYAEIRNAPRSLDKQYVPIPLYLLIDGKEVIFEKGFGLGPPFEMTYLLPAGIYSQFHSTIGINSRLGTKAGVFFEILGDDIPLVSAKCATVGSARTISCNLANIKRLKLKVEFSGNNPWLGDSHAIWGNPELRK